MIAPPIHARRPTRRFNVAPVAHPYRSAAFWALFAMAAVVFVLDATTTIHVASLRPLAIEQNPIARWSLELHPIAPYVLKAGIVGECVVVAVILRAMHERLAAAAVVAMMAAVGLLGIATGVQSLLV